MTLPSRVSQKVQAAFGGHKILCQRGAHVTRSDLEPCRRQTHHGWVMRYMNGFLLSTFFASSSVICRACSRFGGRRAARHRAAAACVDWVK